MALNLINKFNKLCDPAKFYLVMSLLGFLLYLVQLSYHLNELNTYFVVTIQVVIILIWTLILNWVCSLKYGVKVAWFLLLMPILFFFVLLLMAYYMLVTMGITKDELTDLLQEEKCSECDKN